MASQLATKLAGAFTPPSAGYSFFVGGVCGVAASGAVLAARSVYVSLFDHAYYKDQSRGRYLEKQTIFLKEEAETAKNGAIASNLAREYDPVALRRPFGKLEAAWRV